MMKKRIMAGMLAMAILVTACGSQKTGRQIPKVSETPETSEIPEVSESSEGNTVENQEKQTVKLKIGREIEPLVSEKIDTSKQGVAISMEVELSSEMTKGDDGSCYYLRFKGKGENRKIIFYRDNGVKVCETTMKNKYVGDEYIGDGFFIRSFAKYGDHFFVVFDSCGMSDFTILTSVDIKTGKWSKAIWLLGVDENVIVYNDCFYYTRYSFATYTDNEEPNLIRCDLAGKEETVISDFDSYPWIQCIVDNKIYYYICEDEVTKIMRCSLDGSNRETLFKCKGDLTGGGWYVPFPEELRVDGDYIYFIRGYLNILGGDFNLICLPLYGGKIEGVANNVSGWYELSEDSIFFYRSSKSSGKIYKVDKNLGEKPEFVTKAYYDDIWEENAMKAYPFHYADGHLMVHGYNKKQNKIVGVLLYLWWDECITWSLCADVLSTYSDDYYWVSEDGEIETTIKGSGVKKKWKRVYKRWWE